MMTRRQGRRLRAVARLAAAVRRQASRLAHRRGGFQFTGVAIAVPKGRPEALAYVTAFLDKAKRSGAVRRAFERAGLSHLDVAP